MNEFDQIFIPVMGLGFCVAVVASIVAGWIRGPLGSAILLPFAILTLWTAMFLGSEMGYRAWQSMPDPPPEAFHDSSPAGALLFGWIPSGIFCGVVFLLTRMMRFAFSSKSSDSERRATRNDSVVS